MSPARAECTDPFVSVVTVSLNAAKTVEDTIASVSLQRVDFAFEHVCVDGGSKDGTREIIDRWALHSQRIRRIYEPDRGIFDAMNNGLRAARGEYVLFLNADDFLVAPDTLATAMEGLALKAANNPDLVVGNVCMGLPGSRGVWRHRKVPTLLGRVRGFGLYPPHQGMFAKRELLGSVGGFDARCRFAGDIIQYYDLERQFRLSVRRLRMYVAFMRAGGAANSGLSAVSGGSMEIYRHFRPIRGAAGASAMVLVKSLQSICEVRYGTLVGQRWFASQC
jgi:glycosyltransferase involved in cell wall biosynthesis